MIDSSTSSNTPLSARDARDLLADLFKLNPAVYWADLLLSVFVCYGSAALYLHSTPLSPIQISAFLVAGIGIFRLATFMHEIAHMRVGHMRTFKVAWNLLVGVPILTPSLFYTSHADHHSNRFYGTPADGEYLPFGTTPASEIVRFLLMIPLVPILAVLRALVLVPLSLMLPSLRRWLLAKASAAVISPTYARRHPAANFDALWLISDLACFAFAATITSLVIVDVISVQTIGMLYLLIVYAIGLNWIRTLAAHRYQNDGQEIKHAAQVHDSINVTGSPLITEMLYPVGLRYHALHHLLPALPYHALGQAHRRLMAELPADSDYRLCNYDNTYVALAQLWRDARSSGERGQRIKRFWRGQT